MPKDSRSLLRTPQNEDVVGKCRESKQIFRLSKWKYRSIQCHDHKSDQINLTGGFPTRVWAVEKKNKCGFQHKSYTANITAFASDGPALTIIGIY